MNAAEFRTRRLALAMSQAGIAKELGVSKDCIVRWENINPKYARRIPAMVHLALNEIERHYSKREHDNGNG